jgi:hypothetical protein
MQFFIYTLKSKKFWPWLTLVNVLFTVVFFWLFLVNNPILYVGFFILWLTLHFAFAVGKYLDFRSYIDSLPRVTRWNERTQRFDNVIHHDNYN